jgi:hypothetical protein
MANSTFNPSIKDLRKEGDHMEKAKEAGAQALDKAKEAGTQAMTSAKEMGAEAVDKVKEAGAAAYDKAKGAAESVGEMATQAACAVGHKADDLTGAAGHEIKAFGDTLAKKSPHEGMAGHASQAVADTIKSAGRYLEDGKLSGMAQDVEQVIKNHPIPALLICFGIGVCIGRAMKN